MVRECFGKYGTNEIFLMAEEDAAVAVAQETKIVRQGIVVDSVPIAAHKGAYQQKQGRFGLVEVGNQLVYDMERVARLNHNLRLGMERVLPRGVEVVQQRLHGLGRGEGMLARVGRKLRHMQVGLVLLHHLAQKIQTLEGAHTGGAHGYDMPQIGQNISDGLAWHGDNFGMHGVPVGIVGFDRLERACADMQRKLGGSDAPPAQVVEHGRGEMQTRGGSGYGALDTRIDGLVGGLVALLGFAVEVGRNRQLAYGIENLGKRESGIIPREMNGKGVARLLALGGTQRDHLATGHRDRKLDKGVTELLGVADHTFPSTTHGAAKRELVVVGRNGLEAEDLDTGTADLVKHQSRLNDTRVVVDQQRMGGDIVAHMVEQILADVSVLVNQQLGVVALGQRVFGDTLIGERIIIVGYENRSHCGGV